MKFREYVAAMQKVLDKKPEIGEMTAIYSIDDEGNGFNEVHRVEPSIGIYDGKYSGEFCSHEEDLHEREDDGEDITLNAVCIN
jgi:hypothetical protein